MTIHTIHKFRTRAAASSFQERAALPLVILLGDDGLYWVVTPAAAARLTRQGYEIAP